MSQRLRRVLEWGVFGLSPVLVSCQTPEAAARASNSDPPPGQVWLTLEEVKASGVQVAAVSEQVVSDTVLTTGIVTLDDLRTGHVFTPVTGRVTKIQAELGQRVKKGAPLATLESPDIGSAVSDSHKAEADLIAAQHDYRRKKDLYQQKAASAADVETAEDNYRTAKAELERSRQKQLLLRAGSLDVVTQTYTLTSPVDGEVLFRSINPGIEVQGQYSGGSSPELFTIGEIDRVWVLGDLYEIDLPRVRVGSHAIVKVIAYPDKAFEGTVDWVSGGLDPTTRTAKVRCTFDNPDKLLRPAMYATVGVAVEGRRALAIPRDALLRLGEYKVVFVKLADDNGHARFERLPVETEEGDGPWLEVTHGLEVGQEIVVRGAAVLSQRL